MLRTDLATPLLILTFDVQVTTQCFYFFPKVRQNFSTKTICDISFISKYIHEIFAT